MRVISTRELLSKHKEVQAILAAGESLTWTSHGKAVAQLIPPPAEKAGNSKRPDFIARARRIGAVSEGATTVAQSISEDRGQ